MMQSSFFGSYSRPMSGTEEIYLGTRVLARYFRAPTLRASLTSGGPAIRLVGEGRLSAAEVARQYLELPRPSWLLADQKTAWPTRGPLHTRLALRPKTGPRAPHCGRPTLGEGGG